MMLLINLLHHSPTCTATHCMNKSLTAHELYLQPTMFLCYEGGGGGGGGRDIHVRRVADLTADFCSTTLLFLSHQFAKYTL